MSSNLVTSLRRGILLLAALLATGSALAREEGFTPRAKGEVFSGRVVGVSDGDTIKILVSVGTKQEQVRVRLAEIDAPEKRQAFGEVSKQSLSGLVIHRMVQAHVVDTDRYGRVVARIYVGNLDVNLTQVTRGLAWAYEAYLKDPSIRAAHQRAQAGKAGLWQDANPVAPWVFRRTPAKAR